MKKTLLSFLAVACIAVTSQMISCSSGTSSDTTSGTPPDTTYKPVRMDGPFKGKTAGIHYRLHQMIVMFKRKPTTAEINTMKTVLQSDGINPDLINRRACNSCKSYVELWSAPNIHTGVHAQGLIGGTGPRGSQGVGQDGLAYYSLNFTQDIPMDTLKEKLEDFDYSNLKKAKNDRSGKDVVRIAVLDTGIDTKKIISTSYLWTNKPEVSTGAKPKTDDDGNCYKDDIFGWNFTGNAGGIMM